MKRFIRIHITNGERNIIGRLSYYIDSLTATPDEGVCKKALLRYGRSIDEVTLRFHSNGIIDKVYIENEVWDVKEQYIDVHNMFKAHRKKSWDFITELPEPKPEQQTEPNPKQGKKRGRKEK